MQDSRFATFRQRCVEWVYGVAHAIHLDKHGAWCAIAIMDKFSTEASAATSNEADSEFRLTTKLTCLCAMMISSKVNGCGRKMTPVVAAHLSAGLFSVQQVLQHECDVMGTLSWDVNFISPYEAIHFLVPHIAPPSAHVVVAEVAEKMIDGARAASPIIGVSAVVSACAAVHIALQHCVMHPSNSAVGYTWQLWPSALASAQVRWMCVQHSLICSVRVLWCPSISLGSRKVQQLSTEHSPARSCCLARACWSVGISGPGGRSRTPVKMEVHHQKHPSSA
jgi:hypothetical protein